MDAKPIFANAVNSPTPQEVMRICSASFGGTRPDLALDFARASRRPFLTMRDAIEEAAEGCGVVPDGMTLAAFASHVLSVRERDGRFSF